MGWRFRKRIKIAPGVNINLSKSGISTTIGKRGASTYRIMIPTIPTFGIGAHQTMMVMVIVMAA